MNNINEIKNRLLDLNDHLANKNEKLEMVIIGGASLIIKELIDRATHDIDCFVKEGDKIFGLEETEHERFAFSLQMNSHANIFGIEQFLKLEDDLEEKSFELSNIKVYVPSTEFLIFTKLLSGIYRKKDMDDIKSILDTGYEIDWKKLSKITEGWAKRYASDKELKEFNDHYENWMMSVIE